LHRRRDPDRRTHGGRARAGAGQSKWTTQHIREMHAQWKANKGKLKACRKEVKRKGLAGDDRWFFMEECMGKS
jgi:hypothetical protein